MPPMPPTPPHATDTRIHFGIRVDHGIRIGRGILHGVTRHLRGHRNTDVQNLLSGQPLKHGLDGCLCEPWIESDTLSKPLKRVPSALRWERFAVEARRQNVVRIEPLTPAAVLAVLVPIHVETCDRIHRRVANRAVGIVERRVLSEVAARIDRATTELVDIDVQEEPVRHSRTVPIDVRVARGEAIEEHRRGQDTRVRDAWNLHLPEALRVLADSERNVGQTDHRQL